MEFFFKTLISRVFFEKNIFFYSSAKKRHERGGKRDEDMDQDESRDVDLRRNTPKSPEQEQHRKRNNDLRSKISSTVVKIKTEKAEEERMKRAEDRRLRYVLYNFVKLLCQKNNSCCNFTTTMGDSKVVNYRWM